MLRILFAGDFVPDGELLNNVNERGFNRLIVQILRNKDFSICNLEAPLTLSKNDLKNKTGETKKADPESVKILNLCNFDAVTLANNHILDHKSVGLQETIEICRREGIKTVGAGTDITEARIPLRFRTKNRNITIINFCENEFSIADEHNAGANGFSPINAFYQIKEARASSDIVIVIFHGGLEYHHIPLPGFIESCKFFIDAGADAVVCHHTHYYSGYTYYNNKPIFYGLGNIYAKSRKKDTSLDKGYIVVLNFEEESISHNIYGHKRVGNTICHMEENEQMEILEHIENLNKIINDKERLNEYWKIMIEKNTKKYLSILFSGNKFFYKIYKKLPFLLWVSKWQLMNALNLVRCESHREVLIEVLKRKING
jgi:poly-gamma-glutamate synthesis protein (capsule biosynthesis protein)